MAESFCTGFALLLHLSPTWCPLLLDALAGSFCSTVLSFFTSYICLLHGVSCWMPWTILQWFLCAFLYICLPHCVSSWMSWLNDFAAGLLACLFFCLPHGVSCRVPWLEELSICVLSFSFIDFPNGVSCWMPWLCHFLICGFHFLAICVCMVAFCFLCLRHNLPARRAILLCVSFRFLYICLPHCVIYCLLHLTKGI